MKRFFELNLDPQGIDLQKYETFHDLLEIIQDRNLIINWEETCEELQISTSTKWFELNDILIEKLECSSCPVSIHTDEGEVTIRLIEEKEEWYDVLSEQLDDECINHKVSGTGTIYIYVGVEKIRIGDHDPNGKCYYDMDLDKVEESFDEFVECIDNEDFEGLEKFIYKK